MTKRLLIALSLALLAGCGDSGSPPGAGKKSDDFSFSAKPGTNVEKAAEKFRTLLRHCPGIKKYKGDIEKVEYQDGGWADFMVTVVAKPKTIPAESYAMGHTCHFSVDDDKATVAKRPCAWLCTGDDMTGIDGEDHSYSLGKLIGPLVRPWGNLREAISGTILEMKDTDNGKVSNGAAKLAIWSAENMRWDELNALPIGKYAMVMKDSESQLGNRICVSGSVIEIVVDNSVPGKKIFIGGMFDDGGRIYRFIAVRSTGEVVERSRARFCGVITGQQHYPNSAGGVAHAVFLVGMFDLPENKTP